MSESPSVLIRHLKRIKKILSHCRITPKDKFATQEEKLAVIDKIIKIAENQLTIIEKQKFDNPQHAERLLYYLENFDNAVKKKLFSKTNYKSSQSQTNVLFNVEFNVILENICTEIQIEIHQLNGFDVKTKIDLEYVDMNKTIPNHNAPFKTNGTALYIGSGPELLYIREIIQFIQAKKYILADLRFPETKVYKFTNGVIEVTNKNGLKLNPRDIDFVMIDQSIKMDMAKYFRKLKRNTFVLFHFVTITSPNNFVKYGLAHVKDNLYQKI